MNPKNMEPATDTYMETCNDLVSAISMQFNTLIPRRYPAQCIRMACSTDKSVQEECRYIIIEKQQPQVSVHEQQTVKIMEVSAPTQAIEMVLELHDAVHNMYI